LPIERIGAEPARATPGRIKLIARAHLFKARLLQSEGGKFVELARREQLNRSYYVRVLRLSYLAPDITARSSKADNRPASRRARFSGIPICLWTGRGNARHSAPPESAAGSL
jgi:hypothetical protein